MPLDPEFAALLGAVKMMTFRAAGVAQLRELAAAGTEFMPALDLPIGAVVDRTIPGPAGDVPVRVYTPQGEGPFPLLVFYHGGGFIIGDPAMADPQSRALCHGAGCVVVSVDYRLAPEHPFPAASDDAYAALLWAAAHPRELDIDARRIAVGGDSAGATLAALVALRARDQNGPALCAQMLMYPGTHDPVAEDFPSMRENQDGPLLTADDVFFCWEQYMGAGAQRRNPQAWPAHAASHRDLPPAFVASAELDPTRDPCEAYAALLQRSGVPTEARRYAGMPHGFYSWVGLSARARSAMDELCVWLRAQFAASTH